MLLTHSIIIPTIIDAPSLPSPSPLNAKGFTTSALLQANSSRELQFEAWSLVFKISHRTNVRLFFLCHEQYYIPHALHIHVTIHGILTKLNEMRVQSCLLLFVRMCQNSCISVKYLSALATWRR